MQCVLRVTATDIPFATVGRYTKSAGTKAQFLFDLYGPTKVVP
jgi:hypothetical protein